MVINLVVRGINGLSVLNRYSFLPSLHLRRRQLVRFHTSVHILFREFFRQSKPTMSSPGIIKIGTHDGVFHCDEALACFMLRLLPEYSNSEIVRTRDSTRLATCHTVVDVGATYDHDKRRYDHHQNTFAGTMSSVRPELGDKYNIKLSSAGLVFAHYGESVIQRVAADSKIALDAENLGLIYRKVYEGMIEEVDAIDNGVPMTDGEPKYKIRTHLSARVHRLNPEWNSSQEQDMDALFVKAMDLVGEELLYTIRYLLTVWLPARTLVKDALSGRFDVHASGEIVEFNGRYPWKEHLFDLEAVAGVAGVVKYVIFNDKPDSWRVQAVPVSPTSFVTRKPLHRAWWGVRDDLLSEVAGVEGCVFCHSTGFIGGNVTRDGALKMAALSLEAQV